MKLTDNSMMMDEPLMRVATTARLIVEPIWEVPIDPIEGPLYRQYIEKNPTYDAVYVRQTVHDMLIQASKALPERYTLILRAGHRPLEVQRILLNKVKEQYLRDNPEKSDEEALEFARTYVSDPVVKIPPHCCGAAVDVDMYDNETNTLVDFGCPVNTDDDISFLNTSRITQDQKANRDILHGAMNKAGFAPFQTEWWHFSYGDQIWADLYAKEVLYGVIDVEN